MLKISRIIFVSGHGVCRAPMAAVLLANQDLPADLEVLARGRLVSFPEPVNPKVEAVLSAHGLTCGDYMSSQLTDEDITEATMLFTMDYLQRQQIIDEYPQATEENTQVLSSFVGDELDVLNPCGGTMTQYGMCYETMSSMIERLAAILREKDRDNGEIEE